MINKYYAHSENEAGRKHSLSRHLRSVTELAVTHVAGASKVKSEVALAGLLHDLGKYGDLFQRRLEGKESGLDHWTAGAWVAMAKYQSLAAVFAIYGHHVGLPKDKQHEELL